MVICAFVRLDEFGILSVTLGVNVYGPASVGTPDTTPVDGLIVSPVGRLPAVIDHISGGVQLAARIGNVYGTPWLPLVNGLVDVIVHTGGPFTTMLCTAGGGMDAGPLVTLTVNVNVSMLVGVPDTNPPELKLIPGGIVPPVTANTGVPAPHPVMVSCTVGEYATFFVPACRLAVELKHPLNMSVIGLLMFDTNVWLV